MQAIITRRLGATNHKPARIAARCANKRRVYSIDQLEDRFPGLKGRDETRHRAAENFSNRPMTTFVRALPLSFLARICLRETFTTEESLYYIIRERFKDFTP